MHFKLFLENEEKNNIEAMLKKLPAKHQALVKGYKFTYQGGNTLKHDNENIGEFDPQKKCITVAAPWHYAREFTTLHEIGHMVWQYILDDKQRKEWHALVKKTKASQGKTLEKNARDSLNQNAEELFCMAYGATYCKHPPITYDQDDWFKFIKQI